MVMMKRRRRRFELHDCKVMMMTTTNNDDDEKDRSLLLGGGELSSTNANCKVIRINNVLLLYFKNSVLNSMLIIFDKTWTSTCLLF